MLTSFYISLYTQPYSFCLILGGGSFQGMHHQHQCRETYGAIRGNSVNQNSNQIFGWAPIFSEFPLRHALYRQSAGSRVPTTWTKGLLNGSGSSGPGKLKRTIIWFCLTAVGHSRICIQISTQRNSVWINSNKICAWERPRPGTVFKIRFLFSKT